MNTKELGVLIIQPSSSIYLKFIAVLNIKTTAAAYKTTTIVDENNNKLNLRHIVKNKSTTTTTSPFQRSTLATALL